MNWNVNIAASTLQLVTAHIGILLFAIRRRKRSNAQVQIKILVAACNKKDKKKIISHIDIDTIINI